MKKTLIFLGILVAIIFFSAFNKNNWWSNVYSSEELAVLDRIECAVLNKLDELEEKISNLDSKLDDIESKIDDTESKIDDIESELMFKN